MVQLALKCQRSVLFPLSPALSSLSASILGLVLSVRLFSVPTGLPRHPAAKNPREKKILITICSTKSRTDSHWPELGHMVILEPIAVHCGGGTECADWSHTYCVKGFPGVKNLPANAWDARVAGSIPGLGRSPRGRHGKWQPF